MNTFTPYALITALAPFKVRFYPDLKSCGEASDAAHKAGARWARMIDPEIVAVIGADWPMFMDIFHAKYVPFQE